MNLLEIKSLKKYYASHKAVDDISFDIPKGAIFGLLGPNGAGKTTLLRMVTGILYPDSGEIYLDGKVFDPQKDISLIGYMPEERGLYKKMKVGEQILYLAQLKGLSQKEAKLKIDYWFHKFEISSWWNKKVGDLSKGMQQKVQFISTVVHDPKLLILDEPFSGLDPINTLLLKDEIQVLSQKGTTIIFSTHRMEQVEEICHQIVLVNDGKKILDGEVGRIKNTYKKFLFRVEIDQLDPLHFPPNDIFTVEKSTPHCWMVKLNPGRTTNEILNHFIELNIPILGFQEILPTLSEIFIEQVEQSSPTLPKMVA
ncbi:MAG: ABC transporter ATP-binding protein [Chitinophagaceae bacterium]